MSNVSLGVRLGLARDKYEGKQKNQSFNNLVFRKFTWKLSSISCVVISRRRWLRWHLPSTRPLDMVKRLAGRGIPEPSIELKIPDTCSKHEPVMQSSSVLSISGDSLGVSSSSGIVPEEVSTASPLYLPQLGDIREFVDTNRPRLHLPLHLNFNDIPASHSQIVSSDQHSHKIFSSESTALSRGAN